MIGYEHVSQKLRQPAGRRYLWRNSAAWRIGAAGGSDDQRLHGSLHAYTGGCSVPWSHRSSTVCGEVRLCEGHREDLRVYLGGGSACQVLDEDPQASTRGGGSAEQGLREELKVCRPIELQVIPMSAARTRSHRSDTMREVRFAFNTHQVPGSGHGELARYPKFALNTTPSPGPQVHGELARRKL